MTQTFLESSAARLVIFQLFIQMLGGRYVLLKVLIGGCHVCDQLALGGVEFVGGLGAAEHLIFYRLVCYLVEFLLYADIPWI